jgi:hypothetical protein
MASGIGISVPYDSISLSNLRVLIENTYKVLKRFVSSPPVSGLTNETLLSCLRPCQPVRRTPLWRPE